MDNWGKAQDWEADWWGDCRNTFNEELKQLLYAEKMGLERAGDEYTPYKFDAQNKRILDIGGGPVSLLLKAKNLKSGVVLDPLKVPHWVKMRYEEAKIEFINAPAEEPIETKVPPFDEAWIYNVLQHTKDPYKIIKNAQKVAKVIRIFEWIDTPTNVGHPHTLKADKLNKWLNGTGKVEFVQKNSCNGLAYYGIFPT